MTQIEVWNHCIAVGVQIIMWLLFLCEIEVWNHCIAVGVHIIVWLLFLCDTDRGMESLLD